MQWVSFIPPATARAGTAQAYPRKRGSVFHTGTTATQCVSPNLDLNFSANFSAAARLSATANVVEPLPDINVAAVPFSRRNSWNSDSNGYLSSAGASSEL